MALKNLRIFISSPGDVAEERLIARRVIGRLDAQFGDLVHLEAIYWESQPLEATTTFQDQIVAVGDTDVAIVILWSRLGTRLPAHIRRADGTPYASGTEFEFEEAVASFRAHGRPRVLTYRKTAPAPQSADLAALEESVAQQQAMERFVARWFADETDGSLKAAFHNFAAPAEFEELLEAHLTRLVEGELPSGCVVRVRAPSWRGRSPLRGLEAFEPEHAAVFFGRTAAVAGVLARLRAQAAAGKAFVLVVSMSGAGKSSLVRAGVLPLMTQPDVVGPAAGWRQAIVRPSEGQGRPLVALVDAIARATGEPASSPVDDVAAWTVARLDALAPGEARCDLALVVDQLEESFSDARIAPGERDGFFAAIDALARCGRVWVLATMRSDAYARLAAAPVVGAREEGDGQFDLLPPTLREIGQIIRLPAQAAGLRFEVRDTTAERLDDVIRDAAAKNPGALPLLQFLLEELYERRSREDVLTFAAYESLGGVEGALARRAESVLDGVSPAARDALPQVLRELVTFGGDDASKALRRVAPRSAFESPGAIELVDALVAARLLVASSGADGEPEVSLAHEALLEFWPRLKTWRDADRELLLVHARVANAARVWDQGARSADLLLARGKPLADARSLVTAGVRLTATERELLDRSTVRARRFAQVRAGAIAGLVVLTLAAGVAAWRARVESGRAQMQATTAGRTTDFMVGLFATADPDQNRGEAVTVREVLDRGVTQIDAELRTEPAVRANLLRAMGQAYNGLGLFPTARELLERSVAQSTSDGTPADAVRARIALGQSLFDDGLYEEAAATYADALSRAEGLAGRDFELRMTAKIGVAKAVRRQGKAEEAEARFNEVLAELRGADGDHRLLTAEALDALGMLRVGVRRYPEAEASLQESLRLRTSLFGERHGKVSLALLNLGALYFQQGRYADARSTWLRALEVDRAVYGAGHPSIAATLNNLGRVELLTNRLEDARGHLLDSLAILRRTSTPGTDDFVPVLNSLAMIQIERGDLQDADAMIGEAMTIAQARKHPFLDQVYGTRAELDLRFDRLDEAQRALDEARSRQRARFGDALAGSEAWRGAILDLTQARIDARRRSGGARATDVSSAFTVLSDRFGPDNFYARRAQQAAAKKAT